MDERMCLRRRHSRPGGRQQRQMLRRRGAGCMSEERCISGEAERATAAPSQTGRKGGSHESLRPQAKHLWPIPAPPNWLQVEARAVCGGKGGMYPDARSTNARAHDLLALRKDGGTSIPSFPPLINTQTPALPQPQASPLAGCWPPMPQALAAPPPPFAPPRPPPPPTPPHPFPLTCAARCAGGST